MRPSLTKPIVAFAILILVVGIGVFVFKNLSKTALKPTPVEIKSLEPTRTVVGHSIEGRNIDAYTYWNGLTHLLFVGGIHGGYEWNSVLLAYTFMDYLSVNPNIVPANITLTVIPSANPDAVYKVVGKEGRFSADEVSTSSPLLVSARFNADGVDLNRNFDCKWQPEGTWKNKTVKAGATAFSEPETQAIRNFVLTYHPNGVVLWHSQSNAVYASQCLKGILPVTLDIMNAYSKASGYPAVKTFDAYTTTGAADDWLASINIPAITVELKTHDTIEWERNLSGIKAFINYFSQKDKSK